MLRCPSRCLHRVIDGILLYEVGPVGLDLQLLEVFRPGFRQLPEVKFKGMLRCSSNVGAEVSPRDVLPGQIVLFCSSRPVAPGGPPWQRGERGINVGLGFLSFSC